MPARLKFVAVMAAHVRQSPAPSAFGAPGIEPRWTHSAKEGIGTAYHSSCHVWFTLSHGILNEIYYPTVDQPNTRDAELLITDGESFCHEEKRDLRHEIRYPERNCLHYEIINSEPAGRYRVVKHVLADPHRSVVLMRVRLEVFDEAVRGKLKLYALLAPHLLRGGAGNSGWVCEFAGRRLFHVARESVHLSFGCEPDFTRRSVGYAGASDGWRDLMDNFRMDWEFRAAERGNIALTAELDPSCDEWTLAIALGRSAQSSATKLLQSLADPFEIHREGYVRQWRRAEIGEDYDFSAHTGDEGGMYRLSRCVLLAHEDKLFQGALIASLSIPWGETRSDDEIGGYHLVWTRDLVQSATALLATGQSATPLRALIWLACIQKADGDFPQNSWIDGRAYWSGVQLDEIASPILLAWRLQREDKLPNFDPWNMIAKAARYLLLQGPVTGQERWEEQSGYSPSTLAVVIAALVCAAEFARRRSEDDTAELILAYADWLAAHVEDWTATSRGELVPGKPRHYLRITPADPGAIDPHPNVDAIEIQLANGAGRHPARNVVGGDFLHLVRLGIRDAHDPLVLDSIEVIDRVTRRELPQGPCWRRYNHDAYGQKDDGSAFDGTGVGRSWPILTGERGHYELSAGRDPLTYINVLERMANAGGMLTEQLWDDDDLPCGRWKRGDPTGSAMPLCWSHAEYVSLVRSRRDMVVFDRIGPAYERYVAKPVSSRHEIWTFRHQTCQIPREKTLRLLIATPAVVRWTSDAWQTARDSETNPSGLPDLYFVDLPTADLPVGAAIEFTFRWLEVEKWEGQNFSVTVN
ncbi:MAG TPA: glycoside hydrolase family 15 protein [Terrimicrobiaceae bacterium]